MIIYSETDMAYMTVYDHYGRLDPVAFVGRLQSCSTHMPSHLADRLLSSRLEAYMCCSFKVYRHFKLSCVGSVDYGLAFSRTYVRWHSWTHIVQR